jgi:hypothetical protein
MLIGSLLAQSRLETKYGFQPKEKNLRNDFSLLAVGFDLPTRELSQAIFCFAMQLDSEFTIAR